MSVTTSMSRWMSSRNTGRWENRDPDQALITASLAAQRAARWRAADELLSEASRRSPGVKVSAKTVPGWSTCSAKSAMETRSIPTPTMLMAPLLHIGSARHHRHSAAHGLRTYRTLTGGGQRR